MFSIPLAGTLPSHLVPVHLPGVRSSCSDDAAIVHATSAEFMSSGSRPEGFASDAAGAMYVATEIAISVAIPAATMVCHSGMHDELIYD